MKQCAFSGREVIFCWNGDDQISKCGAWIAQIGENAVGLQSSNVHAEFNALSPIIAQLFLSKIFLICEQFGGKSLII